MNFEPIIKVEVEFFLFLGKPIGAPQVVHGDEDSDLHTQAPSVWRLEPHENLASRYHGKAH